MNGEMVGDGGVESGFIDFPFGGSYICCGEGEVNCREFVGCVIFMCWGLVI